MTVMRTMRYAAAAVLALATGIAYAQKPVSTDSGALQGTTANGVRTYLGVPFAAPPVGDLRWKAPQPVHRSAAPLVADKYGSSCMQTLSRSHVPWTEAFMVQNDASEDCLYLNIWTPEHPKNAAVLVFFHGGGFSEGSGSIASYDGAALARKGIIVVDANYRLGIFGFFASTELMKEGNHGSAGNYGLLDQVAAVEWVRRNIAALGGDPKRVTIGGQSAGGMSVELLLQSPLLRGKIAGGIINSGLLSAGFTSLPQVSQVAASGDGFTTKHGGSLVALRQIPAADLLAMTDAAPRKPVIDGVVVTKSPEEAMTSPVGSDVPVITGWNADESLGSGAPKGKDATSFRADAEKVFGAKSADFLKLYPASDDSTAKQSQVQASRDRNLMLAALWAQQWHSHRQSHAFLYFFTRVPPWHAHPEFGAHHTAEIPYFFGTLDKVTDRDYDATDRAVSLSAMTAWVRFVQGGNPGGDWPIARSVRGPFHTLGDVQGKISGPDPAHAAFWESVLATK